MRLNLTEVCSYSERMKRITPGIAALILGLAGNSSNNGSIMLARFTLLMATILLFGSAPILWKTT
jgi:hypothetical protein